jgi:hypothetical protein
MRVYYAAIVVVVIVVSSSTECLGTAAKSLVLPANLPDVWGGNTSAPPGGVLGGCSGWLFGFSGLDGLGSEIHNFAALVEGETVNSFDLRFCGLQRSPSPVLSLTASVNLHDDDTIKVATNDLLILGHASTALTFSKWNVLVGTGFDTASLKEGVPSKADKHCFGVTTRDGAISLCRSPGTSAFALAFSNVSSIDAMNTADKTLSELDMTSLIQERLQQYNDTHGLPKVLKGREKLRNKCVSIMRVNALAPEGLIKQHWSTPDRMPHTWMWLWDSCFHSIAMNLMPSIPLLGGIPGHTIGWEYLKSVLDAAGPNGAISIKRTPTSAGTTVDQTQPPLLSWAVWQNYKAGKAACGKSSQCTINVLDRLKYAFPRLEGYLMWDKTNRIDPNHKVLGFSWIKGTESGMDNSQRFDDDVTKGDIRSMIAVDFSTFFALDSSHLSQIALELENADAHSKWSQLSENVSSVVHNYLWDHEKQFYFDRSSSDGQFSEITSVASFLPMLLDDFPATKRLASLTKALANEKTFNTPISIPSVSLQTKEFSTDMWRGPMWINTNYFVIRGLRKHGQDELASKILKTTIACVEKWYQDTGVFYEFYDATGKADPRTLMRKGAKTGGVRDYHWTAALILQLLVDEKP